MNTTALIVSNLILSVLVIAGVYAIAVRALRYDRRDAAAKAARTPELRHEDAERIAA